MGVRDIFSEEQYEAFIPFLWEIWEIARINLTVSGNESCASWSCSNKSSLYKLILYYEMESCVSFALLFCHVAVANLSFKMDTKQRESQPYQSLRWLTIVGSRKISARLMVSLVPEQRPWWVAADSFIRWKHKVLLTGAYDGHCSQCLHMMSPAQRG